MSWWDKATTEQRLAQIDGGIECGMNAAQIAFNCGIKGTDKRMPNRFIYSFVVRAF